MGVKIKVGQWGQVIENIVVNNVKVKVDELTQKPKKLVMEVTTSGWVCANKLFNNIRNEEMNLGLQ